MTKQVRLNRRFQLEERVETPDGAGGATGSWNAIGSLWGELRFGYGRLHDDGGLNISRGRFRILTHSAPFGSDSRPVAGQVLSEGARRFVVQAVGEYDADARYLICHAQEEVVK